MSYTKVEKYGLFELVLAGTASGNPFVEAILRADFQIGHRVVTVDGFYDGEGII